ncbi:MAG: L-threonylcarbamoyladenylate synthase [Dehalococcoidales bacterium]
MDEKELKKQIERGITTLRGGGVVAFPTDTVYGLGASIYCEPAVERIYRLKQRSRGMALPLLVASVEQMETLVRVMPAVARRLLDNLPHGELTLVLPASAAVPVFISGGGTVAVRITAHPVALKLIAGLGSPVIATSANLSGRPSATTAAEVRSQLGKGVDVILDGGPSPGGTESTIVDLVGETPGLLREGAIPLKEIERLIQVESGSI